MLLNIVLCSQFLILKWEFEQFGNVQSSWKCNHECRPSLLDIAPWTASFPSLKYYHGWWSLSYKAGSALAHRWSLCWSSSFEPHTSIDGDPTCTVRTYVGGITTICMGRPYPYRTTSVGSVSSSGATFVKTRWAYSAPNSVGSRNAQTDLQSGGEEPRRREHPSTP
jgi:hypothetical protein